MDIPSMLLDVCILYCICNAFLIVFLSNMNGPVLESE